MATQKLRDGQTFPVSSDPRIGLNKGQAGMPLSKGKKNGKVFANYSPGETCGAGQEMEGPQGGPSLKNSTLHKAPAEDKSSRGENQER